MAEHTPGPWDLGPMVGLVRRIMVPSDKFFVANVVADVHMLENARLIAAAPDLLEAAKRVIEEDLPFFDEPVSPLDALKAAVARAEGGDTADTPTQHTER